MIATDKAEELLGVVPLIGFMDGHRATFEWFSEAGMADADSPLVDPLWRASWDFEWEAEVAARVRGAALSRRRQPGRLAAIPNERGTAPLSW